jgi:hypothetical protein
MPVRPVIAAASNPPAPPEAVRVAEVDLDVGVDAQPGVAGHLCAREPGQYGCYEYGIVPADVELAGDVRGVEDPPGRVQLVRHGNLAGLVSEVDLTRGWGRQRICGRTRRSWTRP